MTGRHLAELRSGLPLVEACTYLNAAFAGPLPQVALDALVERVSRDMHTRTTASWYADLMTAADEVRRLVGRVVGADPGEVALTHSATEALNLAFWGLVPLDGSAAGGNLVAAGGEHPALIAPLRAISERTGAELRLADRLDEVALVELCDERTLVVGVSHVDWLSGSIIDVADVARQVEGVPVVVDGAQAAGAIPVDVNGLGCAAYAMALHKWTLGPPDTGALATRKEWPLKPSQVGNSSLVEPARPAESEWWDDARMPGAGAYSLASMCGVAAGLQFLAAHAAPAVAGAHSRLLNRTFREALGPMAERATGHDHIVALPMPDPAAAACTARLAEQGIVVRDIPGFGCLRLSFGAWNTADEVGRAAEVIAAVGR